MEVPSPLAGPAREGQQSAPRLKHHVWEVDQDCMREYDAESGSRLAEYLLSAEACLASQQLARAT